MLHVAAWFYVLGYYTIGPFDSQPACVQAQHQHVQAGLAQRVHQGECFLGWAEHGFAKGEHHDRGIGIAWMASYRNIDRDAVWRNEYDGGR